MNDLKCSVRNCISNCGEKCSRNGIHVSGECASSCGETCCTSFSESRGGFRKSLYGSASSATEISCDVENCVHNESGRCRAERVSICGGGSGSCECTECGSFRARKQR